VAFNGSSAAKLATATTTGVTVRSGVKTQLDPQRRSDKAKDFESRMRHRVVGQDPAILKVAEIYQMFLAGMNPPGRPVGNLLFLGPTGSGKTRVVEAAAESLFGDPRACIKIDCAEFQHSHEIAKLIGSPPGYLGHRETHPLLTQEALNQWHTEDLKLSILLFDEIEKASDSLWQLLLGMLDKATLTLGDNRRVDLSQCIIVMTSNLGGADMINLQEGGGLGFGGGQKAIVLDGDLDAKMERTAVEAARRKFTPEFMNRLDKVVVFKTLRDEHLREILEIELGFVQSRVLYAASATKGFLIQVEQQAKEALLLEGTEVKYGARHLKRAIERNITHSLASLVATGQVGAGDVVNIDYEGDLPAQGEQPIEGKGRYTFVKSQQGVVMPSVIREAGAIGSAASPTARITIPKKF
jgi:ATP-dependent Clp protease ATP-binding subunit ClpB